MTELQFLLAVIDEMQLRGWKADLATSAMGRPFARATVGDEFVLTAAIEPLGDVMRPSIVLVERGRDGNVSETFTTLACLTPLVIREVVDGLIAEFKKRPA